MSEATNPISPTAGSIQFSALPPGLDPKVSQALNMIMRAVSQALNPVVRNFERLKPALAATTQPTTVHESGESAPYLSGDVIIAATSPIVITQDAGTNTETWSFNLAAIISTIFDDVLNGGNGSGGGSLIGTPVSLPGSGTTRTLTQMGNYAFSGGGVNFDLILPTLDGSQNENGMVILRETAGAGVTITISGDGFVGPPPAVPVDINGGGTYVWTVPSFGFLWLQNDGVQWVVANIGP